MNQQLFLTSTSAFRALNPIDLSTSAGGNLVLCVEYPTPVRYCTSWHGLDEVHRAALSELVLCMQREKYTLNCALCLCCVVLLIFPHVWLKHKGDMLKPARWL